VRATVFIIFDKFAERYDKWYVRNKVTALNELRLVKEILPRSIRVCVEVGGGTGFFSAETNCVNIDPARNMLAISRKRGVDSVQGVGEHLPIRSSSVDAVLIIVTLCFVDEPIDLLLEARRVLRDKGSLITCIVPRESPWGVYYSERRSMSPFYRYARFYGISEVHRILIEAGFNIVEEKATLSYKPWERPRYEAPEKPSPRHGFVCIRAVKT